jgi:hypothetical protein
VFRSKPSFFMLVMTSVYTATLLTACDPEQGDDQQLADNADNAGMAEAPDQIEDETPPPTETSVGSIASQSPDDANHHHNHPLAGTIENFYFSSATDTIALTSATGGLFGPFPAGIPMLDEPEINTGFLFAFKIYDQNDNLVGFGTEQEVQDYETASAISTLMLTLPARGTLMLEQVEDFSLYFAEIEDMMADEDYHRCFNPPLEALTTVAHTGKIVGGTGEFEDAKGKFKEFDFLYEINLLTQEVHVDVRLRVKFK